MKNTRGNTNIWIWIGFFWFLTGPGLFEAGPVNLDSHWPEWPVTSDAFCWVLTKVCTIILYWLLALPVVSDIDFIVNQKYFALGQRYFHRGYRRSRLHRGSAPYILLYKLLLGKRLLIVILEISLYRSSLNWGSTVHQKYMLNKQKKAIYIWAWTNFDRKF